MVTKLQEIINYKKEEFTFRRNQTNNFELQSKVEKEKAWNREIESDGEVKEKRKRETGKNKLDLMKYKDKKD